LRQAQAQAHLSEPKEYHFLAWVDQELVGRVTLRSVEREHYFDAHLGYRFSQKHAGKGYATKAVSLVLEFAFKQLGLHRIEALVIEDNLPSQKSCKKCHFKQYGHSRSAVLRHGNGVICCILSCMHLLCKSPNSSAD